MLRLVLDIWSSASTVVRALASRIFGDTFDSTFG